MTRFYVIGGILAVALMVYALVDLIITDDRRIGRLNRVLWVVLIVLVPVIGPLGWLFWGKSRVPAAPPLPPDDDPAISGPSHSWMSEAESDRRIREIEAQLQALDAEEQGERDDRKPDDDPSRA